MEKIRLNNSFLAFIQYDKDNQALFVTLKKGQQYKYTPFTESSWNKLKQANNKGSYVSLNIVGNRELKCESMGVVPADVLNQNTNYNYQKFLAK